MKSREIIYMNCLVGIVIPIYNAERYLNKCVDSIRKQTFQDWRLCLVDDGSTDESGKICDEYQKKDGRISVIHKINGGCVEARKTGVFSTDIQACSYIMFADSDDVLPQEAIERLYQTAVKYEADVVCGKTLQVWKGIIRQGGYKPPCFEISSPEIYEHDRILDELYISCFGISNFPVSLWGKIYRTSVITEGIQFEPVVQFMGEDICVVVRILPVITKLVIIPDVVYHYRIGGGTSKFMPYMINDFVNLYNYKKEYADKYKMPYDVEYLMDVELLNTTKSHFTQCYKALSKEQWIEEVKRVCGIDTVRDAAIRIMGRMDGMYDYARTIEECDVRSIGEYIKQLVHENRWRDFVKNVLYRL